MQRNDAVSALKIYQKSGSQAERLSEFFETCRGLEFGRGQKFVSIKKPPASFMTTMEEYIKEAPTTLMLEYNADVDDKEATATENAASEGDLLNVANQHANDEDKSDPSAENNETATPTQAADLMGLYDLLTGASEFDENSLALAVVVPTENSLDSTIVENGASPATGWELALFAEPESSNENAAVESIGGSELEVSNLDTLYDEANNATQQNGAYHTGQVGSNPFDFGTSHEGQYNMNAFYGTPNMASQIPAHMEGVPFQNLYMMQQQQQEEPLVMNKKSTNPFDLDEQIMLPTGMPTPPTQSTTQV